MSRMLITFSFNLELRKYIYCGTSNKKTQCYRYKTWERNLHIHRWLTRRMPLVEQELLILPEHIRSPPIFSGVRVTRSLVLHVCFADRCLSFCTFSFGIVLSGLHQYTDSDYPFGIFKLFLNVPAITAHNLSKNELICL